MYILASISSRPSLDRDIGTVRPHLCCRIAIVAKAQDIFARLDIGHLHNIEDRWPLPEALSIARRWEWQPAPWHFRWRVGASRAVTACCLRAGHACSRAAVTRCSASVNLFALLTSTVEVPWVIVIVHIALASRSKTT